MTAAIWTIIAVVVLALIVLKILSPHRTVVLEYQRGLKYRKGRFVGLLTAGRYWVFPPTTTITILDVRPVFITIPGQEVITADGVTVKVSLAAEYEVADPPTAMNKNANFNAAFYLVLQMAVRQIVGREKVDAIIENRTSISERIRELTQEKTAALGLGLLSADIKDVMLPGELRRTFAQVIKAQKEGLAALERARGETAALRNLANAAKMVEDNPNLLQLRALQTLADSTGNTIMFGVPAASAPVPGRNGGRAPAKDPEQE
jgi:regulator of protease activity HflC (stomatin/prohibitin superfamily)